jgi:hypothetical protein
MLAKNEGWSSPSPSPFFGVAVVAAARVSGVDVFRASSSSSCDDFGSRCATETETVEEDVAAEAAEAAEVWRTSTKKSRTKTAARKKRVAAKVAHA